jgi:hypothetical protein
MNSSDESKNKKERETGPDEAHLPEVLSYGDAFTGLTGFLARTHDCVHHISPADGGLTNRWGSPAYLMPVAAAWSRRYCTRRRAPSTWGRLASHCGWTARGGSRHAPSVANRVTLPVTLGRSVCRRTGNRANSGDVEAEGWRMAVVLKSTAFWGPPYSGRIGGVCASAGDYAACGAESRRSTGHPRALLCAELYSVGKCSGAMLTELS